MSSAGDRDAADEQLPAARSAHEPVCNAPEVSSAAPSCAVCWDKPREVLFTACGHAVLCTQCFERLLGGDRALKCPLCNTRRSAGCWRVAPVGVTERVGA